MLDGAMEFEWDEDKRKANVGKHGIDFAAATRIWHGAVVDPSMERLVSGELRLVALGTIETDDTVIAVVYTERESVRRIISARRARRYERKDYQNAFGRGT